MSLFERFLYGIHNSIELISIVSSHTSAETYHQQLYQKYDECLHKFQLWKETETLEKREKRNQLLINEYDIKECQKDVEIYWSNIKQIRKYLPLLVDNLYKYKFVNYLELHKNAPYLYKLNENVKKDLCSIYKIN
jgi:hypothetical protein